jgi:hypothetical protein
MPQGFETCPVCCQQTLPVLKPGANAAMCQNPLCRCVTERPSPQVTTQETAALPDQQGAAGGRREPS